MLAQSRFNRFSLALSLGYDFLREVTDAYFLFPYPFLLSSQAYKVRARGLPDAERDRNLETLRYIGEQCVAHGLDFQLGLWMHGYEWANSPKANYTIEGLDNGHPRAVLPRCACHAAEGRAIGERRDLPHSRRKRRGGGQLRLLGHGFRRREALRPQGRNRPARQGHRFPE